MPAVPGGSPSRFDKRPRDRRKLGPVHATDTQALLPQKGAGKARGETFSDSKRTTSNTAWTLLGRNPTGRGHFSAGLRCNSLMYSEYKALTAPCPAKKLPPSLVCP